MRDTKIIMLYAASGAGKSTTASGVFHELKKRNILAEYVPERAKYATWEKNYTMLGFTPKCAMDQIYDIQMLIGKVDYIVTDSPPLVSSLYFNDETMHLRIPTINFIKACYSKWNTYNFFLKRSKPFEPAGRNETEAQAKELDKKLLDTLSWHSVGFIYVDYDTAVEYILKEVL